MSNLYSNTIPLYFVLPRRERLICGGFWSFIWLLILFIMQVTVILSITAIIYTLYKYGFALLLTRDGTNYEKSVFVHRRVFEVYNDTIKTVLIYAVGLTIGGITAAVSPSALILITVLVVMLRHTTGAMVRY